MSSQAYRILVVCTANICRSPAAQLFLEDALADRAVVVESAGTRALDGNPADQTIVQMMLEKGHQKIVEHRSRMLMPSHTSRYDLILCMEQDHLASLQRLNPGALGRSKLLGHWNQRAQVDDPVGRSPETYRKSLVEMEMLAQQWAQKMIEMGFVS